MDLKHLNIVELDPEELVLVEGGSVSLFYEFFYAIGSAINAAGNISGSLKGNPGFGDTNLYK